MAETPSDDNGTQELLFFAGRRSMQSETIPVRGFQAFVSGTFAVWGAVLFVFFAWVRTASVINHTDLGAIAQLACALSAIALAIIAIVQSLNGGERYLKLGLGVLSLLFIIAALLALCGFITLGISDQVANAKAEFEKVDRVFQNTIEVYLIAALFAAAAVGVWFPKTNAVGTLTGSFIVVGVPLFLWISVTGPLVVAMALVMMIGGIVGLAVLSLTLLWYIIAASGASVEERISAHLTCMAANQALPGEILAILRNWRDRRSPQGQSSLMPVAKLSEALGELSTVSGSTAVQRALGNLIPKQVSDFSGPQFQ